MFSELEVLSTSSSPRKCVIKHQKLSFSSRLCCPDTDPIKKAITLVLQVKTNILSPLPAVEYVHMHFGCYCIIPIHTEDFLRLGLLS